jgi:hypothetical protein
MGEMREALTASEILHIINAADPILNFIVRNEPGQTGGVLCIADLEDGAPLLTYAFGAMSKEEYEESATCVTEKITRLARFRHHYASSQSRNMLTTPRQYGGAVRGKRFILSFSGFTEEQDEAAMLALELALNIHDTTVSRVLIRQCCEQNPYFNKLQQAIANSD